ncbi:MAG TPA: MaoC family dehydratase [Chloroflexota bacterium]|nr:MaoC family dehydratase [Chloroflexota bacterium]
MQPLLAHGVLSIGYMSTASTKILEGIPFPCVSYGYDRVRFVRPVFIGDTITVVYEVTEKVPEKAQLLSKVTVTNQKGEVVSAAVHILKFV